MPRGFGGPESLLSDTRPPGSWVTITLRVQVGADVPVGRVRDIRIPVRSFYSSQVRDVVVAEVVLV